jgi:Co/Zn/Cd efflux system component
MYKTEFHLPGMDCPTEERIVRMKIEHDTGVRQLIFELSNRRLFVIHEAGREHIILKELETLGMGVKMGSSEKAAIGYEQPDSLNLIGNERKILWIVLAINFLFFVGELFFGLLSGSMGLVADSLDMLADSFVYALALMAVGARVVFKKRVARISGYLQISLALIGFAEVIRRFLGYEVIPDFRMMIIVSGLALIANVYCFLLLQRVGSKDAHMQASIIFTSNDIVINLGVIAAGVLVWYLKTPVPDLIVGAIVFAVVLRGAMRILKLAK